MTPRPNPRPLAPGRFAGLRPVSHFALGQAVAPVPFAVLDLETTGLRSRSDRIIEVAVVRCAPDGTPLSEWSSLVAPPDGDPGPTHVHGISATDLHDAPDLASLLPTLLEQLDGTVIVAHNLAFDSAFLAHEFQRCGRQPLDNHGLCTLELARRMLPGQQGHSLAACAAAFDIPHPDAHRALADTQVTARLLRALLQQLDSPDWAPLDPVLRTESLVS